MYVIDGFREAGKFVGCFSLVAFLPEPLAGFVNEVRGSLEPGCDVKGHLTLLPPRRLAHGVTAEHAWAELQTVLQNRPPFHVRLDQVRLFDASGVVHLSLGEGLAESEALYRSLLGGCFSAEERYRYQPHVTLAHLGPDGPVQEAFEEAKRRWAEYAHSRSFYLDQLTFVECTAEKCWKNLHSFQLRAPVSV